MKILISNTQKKARLNLPIIKRDLRKILTYLGHQRTELSISFVGKKRMIFLNNTFRGINKCTDVLSFPMNAEDDSFHNHVLGDIVVCVPTATSQSLQKNITLKQELRTLLIHGLLHLLGYDHELSPYQKNSMTRKEKELLNVLERLD